MTEPLDPPTDPTPSSTPSSPTGTPSSSRQPVTMPGFSSATTDPTIPPSKPAAATDDGGTAAGTSPAPNGTPPGRNTSAEESPQESFPGDPEPGEKAGKPLGRKNFERAIGSAVAAGAKIAHTTLARSDEEQELLLYLADDKDVAGISGPAASLLARRGVGGNVGAETSDLIELGFAVAEYVGKQIGKMILIRQFRKAKAAGDIPPEAHISAYIGGDPAAA